MAELAGLELESSFAEANSSGEQYRSFFFLHVLLQIDHYSIRPDQKYRQDAEHRKPVPRSTSWYSFRSNHLISLGLPI